MASKLGHRYDNQPSNSVTTMKTLHTLGEEAKSPSDPIERDVLNRFIANYKLTAPFGIVIVPAYNEEDNIELVLKRIPSRLHGTQPIVTLVVSDGSTDRTYQKALEANALAVETPINRGQGAALRLGYLLAIRLGAKVIGIVDADGQWDPADLAVAMEIVESGVADFVQGSRVLGTSEVGDAMRSAGVVLFAKMVSLLIGAHVTDTSSGLRALSSDLVRQLRLRQNQYQSAELLLEAAFRGAKIKEFPVRMVKRHSGHSKKAHNILYGIYYWRAIVSTFLREDNLRSRLRFR